jgi:cytochrome c biogenesis protein
MNFGNISSLLANLWSGLRSLKLSLLTLFLLAGSSVLGTILPQKLSIAEYHQRLGPVATHLIRFLQLDDMYHSWWFVGLLGLFALNLAACTVHRLPGVWRQITRPKLTPSDRWLQNRPQFCEWRVAKSPEAMEHRLTETLRRRFSHVRRDTKEGTVWLFAQKQPWARLGAYVTHLAILIILLGGVVGSKGGFQGYVTIVEGHTVERLRLNDGQKDVSLGFGVRCDRFAVEYYADSDRPKEFRSLLTILEDGREVPGLVKVPVRVNHPLRYRGLTFYQSGYGVDAHLFRFRVKPRGGDPFELEVPSDRMVSLPDGTSLAVAGYLPDFEGRGPVAGLQFVSPDGRPGRAMAFYDSDLGAGRADAPYTFRLLSIDQRWYTGLQVSRDPGVPLVWLGCLLLVLGTLAAFYFSHQCVWLQLKPDGSGTCLRFAGQTHRHGESFGKRFDNLCHDLQQSVSEELS